MRNAVLVWASSSTTLREGNERMTQRAVRDLDRLFRAELDAWGDRRRVALEALTVAASAGAWDVLRATRASAWRRPAK